MSWVPVPVGWCYVRTCVVSRAGWYQLGGTSGVIVVKINPSCFGIDERFDCSAMATNAAVHAF